MSDTVGMALCSDPEREAARRAKISAAHKGRKLSPETRAKIAEACRERALRRRIDSGDGAKLPRPRPVRFFSQVKVLEGGCWVWAGGHLPVAYGTLPHRASYRAFFGEIPLGYEVSILCATPVCCQPAHLEAVPREVNVMRSRARRKARIDG